jgi:hypothetical protein
MITPAAVHTERAPRIFSDDAPTSDSWTLRIVEFTKTAVNGEISTLTTISELARASHRPVCTALASHGIPLDTSLPGPSGNPAPSLLTADITPQRHSQGDRRSLPNTPLFRAHTPSTRFPNLAHIPFTAYNELCSRSELNPGVATIDVIANGELRFRSMNQNRPWATRPSDRRREATPSIGDPA